MSKEDQQCIDKTQCFILPCQLCFFVLVKPGCPSEQILEELGSEIHSHSVYSWKKLARRLEINEGKINSIDEQEKELSEKAYKMLLFWKQVNGRGATYEVLLKALTDKLVNRADLAKMYCCES